MQTSRTACFEHLFLASARILTAEEASASQVSLSQARPDAKFVMGVLRNFLLNASPGEEAPAAVSLPAKSSQPEASGSQGASGLAASSRQRETPGPENPGNQGQVIEENSHSGDTGPSVSAEPRLASQGGASGSEAAPGGRESVEAADSGAEPGPLTRRSAQDDGAGPSRAALKQKASHNGTQGQPCG